MIYWRYMKFLFRRIFNFDIVDDLLALCREQDAALSKINSERAEYVLENSRATRNLVQAFIVALDEETDHDLLREKLREGLSDLSDEVARLEEHAPR